MKELNDLKNIWQMQETDVEVKDILQGLKEIEQKVKKEKRYLLKSFSFTTIILGVIAYCFHSWLFTIGIILIILAMGMVYYLFWGNRAEISDDQNDLSNQQFVKANIDFLEKRRSITSKFMPIYAFLLILGLNISYLDILPLFEISFELQFIVQLTFSLLMAIAFYFSIKNHLKKFDEKVQPLVDELEGLIKE